MGKKQTVSYSCRSIACGELSAIVSSSTGSTAALIAIVVAELALTATALSVRGLPADGVMVRSDQVAISVKDQDVFKHVTVEQAQTPTDSFVVVQSDWGDGIAAEVISYKSIPAGESREIEIEVNDAMGLPPRAFVSLFADRGERGKFEYSGRILVAAEGDADMGMGMGTGTGQPRIVDGAKLRAGVGGGGMDSGIDKPLRTREQLIGRNVQIVIP